MGLPQSSNMSRFQPAQGGQQTAPMMRQGVGGMPQMGGQRPQQQQGGMQFGGMQNLMRIMQGLQQMRSMGFGKGPQRSQQAQPTQQQRFPQSMFQQPAGQQMPQPKMPAQYIPPQVQQPAPRVMQPPPMPSLPANAPGPNDLFNPTIGMSQNQMLANSGYTGPGSPWALANPGKTYGADQGNGY